MPKYWSVVHQRNKDVDDENIKWRLREWNEHPLDPGWERGEFSICHKSFRGKATEGDLVFDVIYPNGSVGDPPRIIRSACRIASKEENILKFDSFHFLDGDWEEGLSAEIRRDHKELDQDKAEKWINSIRNSSSYNEYPIGEKPQSIPEKYWKKMLEKTPGVNDCHTCC